MTTNNRNVLELMWPEDDQLGVYYSLPDGKAIVPLSEAITSSIQPDDYHSITRIRWKNEDFICVRPPYKISWYKSLSPNPRVIPSTPQPMSFVNDDMNSVLPIFRAWFFALLSTLVDNKDFFQFSGDGKVYTLTPSSQSLVLFQKMHIGPGAIPTKLADQPRGTIVEALQNLNKIMGTTHSLKATNGLSGFLEFMMKNSHDFGELYGRVRPWWYKDAYPNSDLYFKDIVQRMQKRMLADDRDRSAIIQEDSYIPSKSHPPPRRIWDLFSNRVLPYYAIRKTDTLKEDLAKIDKRLWTVSHSWLAEEDREDLWTNINGKQWPVPFPRATTFEHVRIELLNMGAEYVWLDVLCLRQEGLEKDEEQRVKEWKIDVPTIGFVYQGESETKRYSIVYLNGLGIPCTTATDVLQSPRHWFNRVWTIQEALSGQWLPGGLTIDSISHQGANQFANIWSQLQKNTVHLDDNWIQFPRDLQACHCTNELDRVAVLGYCLHRHCDVIPVYDLNTTSEKAWKELCKHFSPAMLTSIFIDMIPERLFATEISINVICQQEYIIGAFSDRSSMVALTSQSECNLFSEQKMSKHNSDEYYHLASIVGPYYITDHGENLLFSSSSMNIKAIDKKYLNLKARGVILPNIPYTLANITYEASWKSLRSAWIVFEVCETDHSRDKHPVIHAIKWGAIKFTLYTDKLDPLIAHASHQAYVIYMNENEAIRQSAYTEQYMDAFYELYRSKDAYTYGNGVWDKDLLLESLEQNWGTATSESVQTSEGSQHSAEAHLKQPSAVTLFDSNIEALIENAPGQEHKFSIENTAPKAAIQADEELPLLPALDINCNPNPEHTQENSATSTESVLQDTQVQASTPIDEGQGKSKADSETEADSGRDSLAEDKADHNNEAQPLISTTETATNEHAQTTSELQNTNPVTAHSAILPLAPTAEDLAEAELPEDYAQHVAFALFLALALVASSVEYTLRGVL